MVKHSKAIVIGSVLALVIVLAVAVLTGPRQFNTNPTEDKQTHLTDEQQQRVNDRLNECFSTGDC